MAIGDVYEVRTGSVTDTHYVDTGMYDTPEYGSVYIVDDDRPALIDTGIGSRYENVLAGMEAVGIAPKDLAVIAPTHVHLDHAGGTGFLAAECPNATVVCHERGARHLVDPERLWEGTKRAVGDQFQFYTKPEPVPRARIREVAHGDVVDLGEHALEIHHAPGHAPHHAFFHDPASDAVFTADAAGIYVPALDEVVPTTPPPSFDLGQCLDDIDAIRTIDPETLLYAHYGPLPAAGRLDEYSSVLTAWVERVEAARADAADDEAAVERLVAETEMDEVWGARKAETETAMNARGVLRYLDRLDK